MVGGVGDAGFCEVFFTDVECRPRTSSAPLNGGWAMAKETLANERVSLSSGRPPVGPRPDRPRPLDLVREHGGVADRCCASGWPTPTSRARSCATTSSGRSRPQVNKKPGPDASLRKALKDPHGKKVFTWPRT